MIGQLGAIRTFKAAEDPAAYDAYLRMKCRVFLDEVGWSNQTTNASGDSLLPEPADMTSVFACAEALSGAGRRPIGFLRANMATPLPNGDLFKADLAALRAAGASVATMNALMVDREFRGRAFDFGARAGLVKASQAMLRQLLNVLQREGADAVLVTAILGPSVARFRSEGFIFLGVPFALSSHGVVNMVRGVSDLPLPCMASTFEPPS